MLLTILIRRLILQGGFIANKFNCIHLEYAMRILVFFTLIFGSGSVLSAPALPDSLITQDQIESGELTLNEIRQAGLRVFATPFNKEDGWGMVFLTLRCQLGH